MTFGETFKLADTANGLDISFDGTNTLEMIEAGDKVGQDITVLFKTQVGEDIFSLSFGADFYLLFTSRTPELVVETIIREALQRYEYFRELISLRILETNYVNRTMTVELSVRVDEEIRTLLVVI